MPRIWFLRLCTTRSGKRWGPCNGQIEIAKVRYIEWDDRLRSQKRLERRKGESFRSYSGDQDVQFIGRLSAVQPYLLDATQPTPWILISDFDLSITITLDELPSWCRILALTIFRRHRSRTSSSFILSMLISWRFHKCASTPLNKTHQRWTTASTGYLQPTE